MANDPTGGFLRTISCHPGMEVAAAISGLLGIYFISGGRWIDGKKDKFPLLTYAMLGVAGITLASKYVLKVCD